MLTQYKTSQQLVDVKRIHDAAATMCESGEALFRYFSRLDALEEAQLSREARAERALEAELQTRLLLAAAMDALNELNDLGLLKFSPTDAEISYFNRTRLSDAGRELTSLLREHMPDKNWDWLDEAREVVKDIDMRIERQKDRLHGTVTIRGKTKVVLIDPAALPQRVSTRQFFSDGPDRIFVPTSSIFARTDGEPEPMSGYDSVVGGLVFAREWMHRHARYATEIGIPAKTGGGPAIAVIAVVCKIVGAFAAVAAAVCLIICAAGEKTGCELLGFFGTAAATLGYGEKWANKQTQQFQYGTNNQ